KNRLLGERVLEEELDRELYDAAALLVGHRSKVRCIQLSGARVEAEIQIASIERPQRVIQEVIPIDSELQLLRLRDLDILEEPKIPAKECRAVDGRELGRAVLADLRRETETARVDELIVPQTRLRIACQDRVELDIGSPQK